MTASKQNPPAGAQTMVRTSIAIGDARFQLSQGQDLDALRSLIADAVHAGGAFVEFVVVGNRVVNAYVTGAHLVVLAVETVPFDERDTGVVSDPYGGNFDLL